MAHFREEETKMGASATMADANCRQWEPSTATRSTLRPKMSSHVKSEPCLGEEIRGEVEFGGIKCFQWFSKNQPQRIKNIKLAGYQVGGKRKAFVLLFFSSFLCSWQVFSFFNGLGCLGFRICI